MKTMKFSMKRSMIPAALLTCAAVIFSTFALAQESSERVLPLEGGRNFRDLGGYLAADGKQVKWGRLYRSGALHKLTGEDYRHVEELGIKTVVDFRSTEERASEKTQWRAGDMQHLSWDYAMDYGDMARLFQNPELNGADMEQLMGKMYVQLLHQQKPHYRAMFERLIASDEPLLFHCTAGKDRTGIGAALILTALGVEAKTIEADYVLSDSLLDPRDLMQLPENASEKDKAMFEFFAQLPEPVIDALMGARPSYLQSAFAEMTRQSGSVDAYIERELGVDQRELALLRAHFLE
jgi:protein-tyrosine phosphatase